LLLRVRCWHEDLVDYWCEPWLRRGVRKGSSRNRRLCRCNQPQCRQHRQSLRDSGKAAGTFTRCDVEAALKKFGRIDVLVNNAGYGLAGALEECSAEETLAQYQTNVFGLLEVTRAVLPTMRAQASGHIINISSVGGFHADPGVSAYCGTKFAVEGLSEALAGELAPLGIRVMIVEPGYFRTELLSENAIRFSAREIEDYAATAGAVRKGLAAMHGKQAGDPRKLALALVRLVNDSNPPLRFLAGADAVQMKEQQLETARTDLEQWRQLSVSLAYDE
jgi:NAD(P)-dependent dehydrogenase (short-subunit alcohol dehydrogenase family)